MKRILRSKIMPWISLGIALLLTVIIVALLVLRTDFFAGNAGRMFSRYLFRGTDFSLSIGRIYGNPLGSLTATDLRVRYNGRDYAFDILRIEEVHLDYGVRSLLSEVPRFDRIVLDRPHVWIKPDSSGANIIPHTGGEGGAFPSIEVDLFRVTGGQMIYQGESWADAIRKIDMEGSLEVEPDVATVDLTSASAEDLRRGLRILDAQGSIGYDRMPEGGESGGGTGRIVLEELRMKLEKSSMTIDGSIDPVAPAVDLGVDVYPLHIRELARVAGLETDHTGELKGSLRIGGTPDSLEIGAILNGVVSGYALDDIVAEGRWIEPVFEFGRFRGLLNGAAIDGNGFIGLEPRTVLDLNLDTEGLDLSEGFAGSESLPETDINGNVKLTWYPDSEDLRFMLDLEKGHIRRLPFEESTLEGSWSPDSLIFESVALVSDTHEILSHGSIAGDRLRIFLDLACAREDTLFPYLGIEQYRTDLELNAFLTGTIENWELRGSGDVRDFEYGGALVPKGEIKIAVRKLDTYEVLFDLSGDSCHVDPLAFSGIDLSLEYWKDVTTVKRLHLTGNGVDAEIRGEVRSGGERTSMIISETRIEALEEVWLGGGEPVLTFEEEELLFEDIQLHSRLGAIYVDCRIDRRDRKIDGDLRFDRMGLSLCNCAGLIETPLLGRGRGRIEVSGDLDDPDVDIDMSLSESWFDTLAVDSLYLKAGYSDSEYGIHELDIDSPIGGVRMEGNVRGVPVAAMLDDWRGGIGSLVADLRASCEDLSLAPFLRFSERIPFDSGKFTGGVTITDSLVHPSAEMEGSITDLSREGLVLPGFEFDADLGGDVVRLGGSVEIAEGHRGEFRGTVPLRRNRWFYSIDDSGRIYIELFVPPGDLAEIPEITDLVAEAGGSYSAGLKIEGTVEDPVILGDLTLKDARFRLSGMEEKFRNVNANILLQDTLITISALEGREGQEGGFRVSGRIGLRGWRPEDYDIDIELDKFLIASIPDVLAIVSGELHLGDAETGGEAVPELTGNIEVNRAEVFYEMDRFDMENGTGRVASPSWIAEIDLEVPGDAWIRTPDANIEMQGQVTLHHDGRGTYLRGRLDLVRGWYNIYGNKFRVRSGSLEFVHAGSLRPVVDIEAETLDPEGRKIFLTLVWLQDDVEPRVALVHEDPGYSETDIWKMLGGGIPDGEGGGWDAVGTAQGFAANYIESLLNSQMEGITIELETAAAADGGADGINDMETMVAVGKYLSEGLYVKYKQGLSISSARHIEVEYRISRLFIIRSQMIKYSEKVLQGKSRRSTDEYNVDLKLRWEF